MRTRSSRTNSNHSCSGVPLNFSTLMRQAPATTTGSPPQPELSSDSERTPSPPPHRRRHRTSLVRSRTTRADVVVRNVAILGVFLAVALLFIHLALYIAIFIVGILAPAWQTYKAIEARDRPVVVELDEQPDSYVAEPREIRNWQAYWVIAAILLAFDGLVMSPFLGRILPGPLYHSMLFTLVTWLTRNCAGNAAAIYDCYIKPACQKSEKTIDCAVDSVITYVDDVSQQAILAVNEAVAPYAKHLEHAAAVASKQIQEQSRSHERVGGHRRRRHR